MKASKMRQIAHKVSISERKRLRNIFIAEVSFQIIQMAEAGMFQLTYEFKYTGVELKCINILRRLGYNVRILNGNLDDIGETNLIDIFWH
jgi:hypothetical protein